MIETGNFVHDEEACCLQPLRQPLCWGSLQRLSTLMREASIARTLDRGLCVELLFQAVVGIIPHVVNRACEYTIFPAGSIV